VPIGIPSVRYKSYFVNNQSKSNDEYKQDEINIFVQFGWLVYQQTVFQWAQIVLHYSPSLDFSCACGIVVYQVEKFYV
jgi:hypothetical protein